MRDGVGVRGHIRVLEHDARTGQLLSEYHGHNRVVSTGLDLIGERVRGNTGVTGVRDYALGTDSTPPVAGDTALKAEVFRGRLTQTRSSGGSLELTLYLGSTEGNGLTFQEGGAFNVENIMLCRAVFPAKAKTSAKTLTIIHTIPLTAS